MPTPSILFAPNTPTPTPALPDTINDLNIDLLVERLTAGKSAYNLAEFYRAPLHDKAAVEYRQRAAQDLENETLLKGIKEFSEKAATVKRYLGMIEQLDFEYHKKGWYLEAALLYCKAVNLLSAVLAKAQLRAPGWLAMRDYVNEYVNSSKFSTLCKEAEAVKASLSEIRYCITLQGTRFKVERFLGGADYGEEIEQAFRKFQQEEAEDYSLKVKPTSGMNHVEAKILEFVSRLYPEKFAALDRFCAEHPAFIDPTIDRFEREVQFYTAYFDFIATFRERNMPFCYPTLHINDKTEEVTDGFDLALADALSTRGDGKVVYNDFSLSGKERVLVVTGPNQGGKTTFARMVGQLHYLAALGLPIPARQALLFLPDRIFTQFERREDAQSMRSKLEDDLMRSHEIITHATSDSLIILNEVFSSTTLQDALAISQKVLQKIIELGAIGVWVTFIEELAAYGEETVSMVAQVSPDDTTKRTFKVKRMPANGLAYAIALARKHHLSTEQIKERLAQ